MSLSDDLKSAISTADVEQNLINTVPELREFIHFDTLWQLASLIVLEHGHLDWSDTAEHDPGTTLLQAATYAIADLSYRHTHPLIDLLTPGTGAPVFDPAFGPEKVLTVSPLTEDDYRRGILDLCDDDDFFMFRNAKLVRESEEERYRYFYDPANGSFTFGNNQETFESKPQVLLGGYTLYVEAYSWLYRPRSLEILDSYLIRHRNLGEQIRLIYDRTYHSLELYPFIDVELDDDCQDPERVMGMIWETVTKLYAPWPRREIEEVHLTSRGPTETLYEGPQLDNGWITQLPGDMGQALVVDLRKLPLELLKIDGVKQVRRLSWEAVDTIWSKNVDYKFLAFWSDYPEKDMTTENSTVRLFKRGQRQILTEAKVKPYINWPKKPTPTPVTVPRGQYLNALGTPINLNGLLPDCYGLNDDTDQLSDVEKKQRQNLEVYLALFQQWVKNGCDELAGLPKLLAFDQPVDSIGSGYFQDYEKALTTINYLLGYFGSQRAPRVFNKTDSSEPNKDEDFFESQRAALAQWAELGYGRANVPINTVTAFNKRLAFRLGIGAEMFSKNPDLEKLPVYVVDYRTLLPEMPNPEFENRKLKSATLVTTDGVEQLKFEFDEGALPAAGQLISLDVVEPSIKILWALVVRVEANYVYLDLENNPRLREKANQLDGLADAGVCNNSDIWLRRMTYPLVYVENLPKAVLASDYFYRLHVPYSVHVFNNGDTVKVDTSLIKSMSHFDGSIAIVEEIDIPSGTLLVKAESEWPAVNNEVFWYRDEADISDRFSLKVGVVLDRERWLKEVRPEEVMTWVEQIVREEMPAHLQADVHWLSSDEFESFGYSYKKWQQAAAESRLGETSYALMKQLSLGQLPAAGRGIGVYHLITTDEERLGAEAGWYSEGDPGHWLEGSEVEVEAASIVYVPRDVE